MTNTEWFGLVSMAGSSVVAIFVGDVAYAQWSMLTIIAYMLARKA